MEAVTDVLAGPMPDFFQPIVGNTSVYAMLIDWIPLALAAVAPLLCIPFVLLGICGQEEEGSLKFGMRTAMKGMMIAVRADIRMGRETATTTLLKKAGFKKGGPSWMQPTAAKLESGLAANRARGMKSPDQSKAKAEEKAIKDAAGRTPPTGASRFY
mmetsp:Transcript_15465/g.39907  ORF Transcript_15465/g.39907 Transcript_15465/m.39907 type:complete len:157 (-) Transcript_15465:359-829(-)|eukprot:CAMPEP_0115880848 /NCGR_PEP_ID=MMETSP0287-20121206/28101_1 /TAXON_ID=412157 /ORGANISM="Chrysochromulina rotalis, Strain UIO044" /LENGTH=156 /DNA_ID=CAMNT_0003336709 /DNA_START=51 /DNA_END=521 /DNA_ORIENTATION=-